MKFKYHHQAVLDLLVKSVLALQFKTPSLNQILVTAISLVSHLHCPVKRKKKVEKRIFKNEWKIKYMMWPVKSLPEGNVEATGAVKPNETEMMMCIHCQEKMKAKSSTATRHLQHKHPASLNFSTEKRERLVRQFEHMYTKQKSALTAGCSRT